MPQEVEVDTYSKVGRGGAGNYVSSKLAAEATKVNTNLLDIWRIP